MWAKIRGWLRLAVKEYNSLIYFLKISKLVPVNTFLLNLYNLKWRFQGSSQPRHTNNLPFPYFDWWIRLKTVSTYVLTDIHIFLHSFFIFLVLDTQVMTDRPLSTWKNVVDLSEVAKTKTHSTPRNIVMWTLYILNLFTSFLLIKSNL